MNSRRRTWFAIGNPLRGDDGVAQHAVSLLRGAPFVRQVHQLTPELAADLEGMDEAVFIDADASAAAVTFEPLECAVTRPLASHHLAPSEVLLLARSYFGFRGCAYLCRIPATDFDLGKKLSAEATKHAEEASHILKLRLLGAVEDLQDDDARTLSSAACGGDHGFRNSR
jgi:hydrogenase maturation protease